MGEILLFNKFFFPIVDMYLSCEDIAQQSCAMQYISNLDSIVSDIAVFVLKRDVKLQLTN